MAGISTTGGASGSWDTGSDTGTGSGVTSGGGVAGISGTGSTTGTGAMAGSVTGLDNSGSVPPETAATTEEEVVSTVMGSSTTGDFSGSVVASIGSAMRGFWPDSGGGSATSETGVSAI